MQLHQLECFLMLSKTLNFTRAAENLYVSQSSLSANIASLEKEIGCKLLTRTTRAVQLTPAGLQMARKAEQILAQVEGLPEKIIKAQEGENGIIHVAFSGGTLSYLVPAIQKLRVSHPQIQVFPHRAREISMMLSMENAMLDATLLAAPCIDRMNWVTGYSLTQSGLSVAVSHHHRLSRQKQISITDLAGETILLFPRPQIPRLYDYFISCLETHHVSCSFYTAPDVEACEVLAAAGYGIMFTPDYISSSYYYGLETLKISEYRIGYDLMFVTPSNSKNPCLKYLKQAILSD